MRLALRHHVHTTLDQILAELSTEPTNATGELELDPLDFEIELDLDGCNEPTQPARPLPSMFAETTVPVDMPWLRAQLW
jgi:hypothetical protein